MDWQIVTLMFKMHENRTAALHPKQRFETEEDRDSLWWGNGNDPDNSLQRRLARLALRWQAVHYHLRSPAKSWLVWQMLCLANEVFDKRGNPSCFFSALTDRPAHRFDTSHIRCLQRRFVLLAGCWYQNFVVDKVNPKEPRSPTVECIPTDEERRLCEDRRMEQRLKQIAYGKTTVGYQNYVRLVPHHTRNPDDPDHPVTPRFYDSCSKRLWDKTLKNWRRNLHNWDPDIVSAREVLSCFTDETLSVSEDGGSL